jgi:3-deoxy-manno-octulosonate cytidylyltransferase (CMP-KDO synthetase)
VYGFRRAALSRFVSLPVSELEALESLEQMRALQAGFEIVVGEVSHASRGVDTPDDLRAARQRLGGS